MKIRNGFVSNSSSASFVVYKDKITPFQHKAIMDHGNYAVKVLKWHHSFGNDENCVMCDVWEHVLETEETIEGWTTMDNFDMRKFFEEIGLAKNAFKFEKD